MPGMDEVAYLLKKEEKKLGCEVVVYAELNTAEILRRKSSMYRTLRNRIATPEVYAPDNLENQ